MLLSNFPSGNLETDVADSVDFMVERLEQLNGKQLGSRLTLNRTPGYVEPQAISKQDIKVHAAYTHAHSCYAVANYHVIIMWPQHPSITAFHHHLNPVGSAIPIPGPLSAVLMI